MKFLDDGGDCDYRDDHMETRLNIDRSQAGAFFMFLPDSTKVPIEW